MGFLTTRIRAVSTYFAERARYGVPEFVGPLDEEVAFILDGVGRFQFAPLLIRRALREEGVPMGTVCYDWQFGLPGEIWTDLMWLRRNRVMGAKLARRLLAFRRAHPQTRIHMIAYSGGAGIGLFALESLGHGRRFIETLLLACPALSPDYNLGPALRGVARAYALVSRKDTGILGLGTRIFGTTDRRFTSAAGCKGFEIPCNCSPVDGQSYERLQEIRWTPELRKLGHTGGHTGWASVALLRRHLMSILQGEPLLPTHQVATGHNCV